MRTHRGLPCIRKLWSAGPVGCVVAEDDAFERLLHGDMSGAVAVLTEDVFRLDPDLAEQLDPRTPFDAWDRLRPYAGS